MSDWFEKDYYAIFKDFRDQVLEFNRIGGRVLTQQGQLTLCREEAKEVIAEYEEDKAAFLKEVCDLFIVSCPAMSDWDFKGVVSDVVQSSSQSPSSIIPLLKMEWRDTHSYLDYALQLLLQVDADWQRAMQLVLDSNMSKFSHYKATHHQYHDDHCKLLECGGRYKNVSWSIITNSDNPAHDWGWIVWKDENQKILKGPDYVEADLSECVY